MAATIHPLPVSQPKPAPYPVMTPAEEDRLWAAVRILRVSRLASEGITPAIVLSWDRTGTDPAVLAMAGELEAYMASAGVAAVLAASGPVS